MTPYKNDTAITKYTHLLAIKKWQTTSLSILAKKMDACYVNDEKVQAQESDFYGGWITSRVIGPFKGGAGTLGW